MKHRLVCDAASPRQRRRRQSNVEPVLHPHHARTQLEELAVSPEEVLRLAGLPAELLDQETILLSTEELFALYRGLADASRDPVIGRARNDDPS